MRPGRGERERWFRRGGTALLLGLVVELASLFFVHPLAFSGFVVVGMALIGLGVVFSAIGLRLGPRPST